MDADDLELEVYRSLVPLKMEILERLKKKEKICLNEEKFPRGTTIKKLKKIAYEMGGTDWDVDVDNLKRIWLTKRG